MKRFLLSAVCLSVVLSGCATIFTKDHDEISFNSVPEGAKVEISGSTLGKTPITVPVKRAISVPEVRVKLDGYETRQVELAKSFNGVAVLNIFFWPGFLIDMATGHIMKYGVTDYNIELDPMKN